MMENVDVQVQKLHEIAEAIRLSKKDKSSIMLYGEEGVFDPVEVIPTGSFLINRIVGVGGFPKGRIVELYGNEGSGKSSIALSVVAEAQQLGILCAYIDAENALSAEFAIKLGVDMERLLVSQQSCTQEVFDTVDQCIDQGIGLVVIDSIAGLCPQQELDGNFGDYHVGLNARLITQALRKLSEKIRQTQTIIICINQIRIRIGVMFGNPETTPGGKALKFYASIRMEVKIRSQLKVKDEVIGIRMGISVPKNKVAPPFKKCETDFYFACGFDEVAEYLDMAIGSEIFTKKGPAHYLWSAVPDKSKTRNSWLAYLHENSDALKVLIDTIDNL